MIEYYNRVRFTGDSTTYLDDDGDPVQLTLGQTGFVTDLNHDGHDEIAKVQFDDIESEVYVYLHELEKEHL